MEKVFITEVLAVNLSMLAGWNPLITHIEVPVLNFGRYQTENGYPYPILPFTLFFAK
jgi:hypothetical protein